MNDDRCAGDELILFAPAIVKAAINKPILKGVEARSQDLIPYP